MIPHKVFRAGRTLIQPNIWIQNNSVSAASFIMDGISFNIAMCSGKSYNWYTYGSFYNNGDRVYGLSEIQELEFESTNSYTEIDIW